MIIVRLQGGLGNQMFQYAAGRALAHRYGTDLKLDTALLEKDIPGIVKRDFDLDVFKIEAGFASSADLRPFLRWMLPKRHLKERGSAFDPRILHSGPDALLDGFWQSENYFADAADIIRSDFRLKDPLPGATADIRSAISSCESVCVNARRGDFVSHPRNSAFHGACGVDYFQNARDIILKKTDRPRFYIFSDDLEWCRENLLGIFDSAEIVGHEHSGDRFQFYLALISACRHQIIPNSSFGWWGAWLNPNPSKVVIAPKRWTNEAVQSPDRIPPSWMQI